MKYVWTTLLSFLIALTMNTATAQDRFGVELRIGPEFATQDLGDATLNTGFGSEVVFSYRFMPHLAAYGGWGYGRAAADGNSFAGTDVDVEETGYTFGLQFIHPIRASRFGYFIRAGGVYNHIEIENTDGDITADSGHGLGWQMESGVVVPIGAKWRLMPGVRYRSLSRDIEVGTTRTDVDLTYVTAGIGIVRTF